MSGTRFKVIEDGEGRWVLVDNLSDDPAPVYDTLEEALAACKRLREETRP